MKQTLRNLKLLEIQTRHGVSTGGSQEWYPEGWQRMSGCGPTAASNLIWYLTRSRPELGRLCDIGGGDKANFVKIMSEMFTFITPGALGVNTSMIFTSGALKYGESHGVTLTSHVLEVPKLSITRPALEKAREFILSALRSDCPIAFLNLSNGNQHRLDGWHWVTIIAINSETMSVSISDQGRILNIDFAAWLKTSLLGGALVYLNSQGEQKCEI